MSQALLSAVRATETVPFNNAAATAFSNTVSTDCSPPAVSAIGQQHWRFATVNAINGDLLVNWGPSAAAPIDPTEGHTRVWSGTSLVIALPPAVQILIRGSGASVNGSVQYGR